MHSTPGECRGSALNPHLSRRVQGECTQPAPLQASAGGVHSTRTSPGECTGSALNSHLSRRVHGECTQLHLSRRVYGECTQPAPLQASAGGLHSIAPLQVGVHSTRTSPGECMLNLHLSWRVHGECTKPAPLLFLYSYHGLGVNLPWAKITCKPVNKNS